MVHYSLIGAIAGIASAVLYLAVTAGNLAAIVLFYAAPLPLYIAGLGWGTLAAIIGSVAGLALTIIVTGFDEGLLFFSIVVIPVVGLVYLALLSRPADPSNIDGEESHAREWYPTGRMLVWMAIYAGALASVFSVLLDTATTEEFRTQFARELGRNLNLSTSGRSIDESAIQRMADFLIWAVPPASAFLWLVITVPLLSVANAVAHQSGFGRRPKDTYTDVLIPVTAALGAAAFLVVAMLSGRIGTFGLCFFVAFVTIFMLQGLAVIHVVSKNLPLRGLMLATAYVIILFTSWLGALLFALIGIAESAFGLRARHARNT